jgi:predicted component of type VI protein secretion system
MKWQKERDDLIAQTKAFVQSVTGRTPQAVLSSVFNKPAPIPAPIEDPSEDPFAVLTQVSPPPLPIEQVASPLATEAESAESKPAETKSAETTPAEVRAPEARPVEATPIDQELPAAEAPPPSDIRKEIQARVAAFQAHQHRFHRERDAYFNSVLTKARSAIEDGPDVPSP